MIGGDLYKRIYSSPMAKCLGPEEARYIMVKVDEGECGNHSGGKSLVCKLLRASFYWPLMSADTKTHVKKCDKCQCHAPLI